MKLIKYQVRWDWINTREEDPVRHTAESQEFVALIGKNGLFDALSYLDALRDQALRLRQDWGIDIQNSRIVCITEETIQVH